MYYRLVGIYTQVRYIIACYYIGIVICSTMRYNYLIMNKLIALLYTHHVNKCYIMDVQNIKWLIITPFWKIINTCTFIYLHKCKKNWQLYENNGSLPYDFFPKTSCILELTVILSYTFTENYILKPDFRSQILLCIIKHDNLRSN